MTRWFHEERDFLIVFDPREGLATMAIDLGDYYLFQPPMVGLDGRHAVARDLRGCYYAVWIDR